MAAHAKRKPELEEAGSDKVTTRKGAVIDDRLDAASLASHPSPARALQARLHAQFAPASRQMLSRYVTLLVMLTCLGTWLAGSGPSTIV
ncbi:MAG: hypothetical protein GYB42_05405 [Alphaproteobacteria bacterium]|nr:hypothetical protein [Alphaproteobacteria bacterium]